VIDFELLRAEAARHPYPLLFATVSGAHLYGFPSPDSDYDLRGAHILDAVLLKPLPPLPYPEPNRLLMVSESRPLHKITK